MVFFMRSEAITYTPSSYSLSLSLFLSLLCSFSRPISFSFVRSHPSRPNQTQQHKHKTKNCKILPTSPLRTFHCPLHFALSLSS
uniref:Putative secreted protein n=1 Tax=Anopheles triannulatus TaxID=58253 RepID=A0A2M4B1B2_9DIPT